MDKIFIHRDHPFVKVSSMIKLTDDFFSNASHQWMKSKIIFVSSFKFESKVLIYDPHIHIDKLDGKAICFHN